VPGRRGDARRRAGGERDVTREQRWATCDGDRDEWRVRIGTVGRMQKSVWLCVGVAEHGCGCGGRCCCLSLTQLKPLLPLAPTRNNITRTAEGGFHSDESSRCMHTLTPTTVYASRAGLTKPWYGGTHCDERVLVGFNSRLSCAGGGGAGRGPGNKSGLTWTITAYHVPCGAVHSHSSTC
jgi:hypothetical protein